MPEGVIEKLGQAFALNQGMVDSGSLGGAGLGLAICKGIAQAHGGWITVRSRLGEGTSFTVHLMADLEAPRTDAAEARIDVEPA